MWFTSRPMTRGRFTDIPSWLGRDGTRIPESGLAGRTSISEWASESAGSEVLDGAGAIGDSIGVADTQCTTMAGTTPGAERFITGAISPAAEAHAAELMVRAADAAELTAVPAQQPQPDLSTETGRLLEAMLNPAARAAHARAPSAATTMADKPRAIRHAEAPAWAAEQRVAAAERVVAAVAERAAAAGVVDRSFADRSLVMFFVMFRVVRKFGNGEKPYAANEGERRQISLGQSSEVSRGRYLFNGVFSYPFDGAATGPENVFIGGKGKPRVGHRSEEH